MRLSTNQAKTLFELLLDAGNLRCSEEQLPLKLNKFIRLTTENPQGATDYLYQTSNQSSIKLMFSHVTSDISVIGGRIDPKDKGIVKDLQTELNYLTNQFRTRKIK